MASINELVVLSNMESFNAELIKRQVAKHKRYELLKQLAESQLRHLNVMDAEKKFRAISNDKSLPE